MPSLWRHRQLWTPQNRGDTELNDATTLTSTQRHGRPSVCVCQRGIRHTIVSLSSKTAKAIAMPLNKEEPMKRKSRAAFRHLDNVAGDKMRRRPASTFPFRPLGGLMQHSAVRAFSDWKAIMTGGIYSLMNKTLSLALLRARVYGF